MDRFAGELEKFAKKPLAEILSNGSSGDCRVAGIVTECRTRRTKKGELMATFKLEDLTGAVEAVVFPSLYVKAEPFLKSDSPILVTGRFEVENENNFKIVASEIQPLDGASARNASARSCISTRRTTGACCRRQVE